MTPLAAWWNQFGPEIVGAVVSGLVAGATAWLLLSKTQRDEAKIRQMQQVREDFLDRKRVVSRLIIDVRNMRDLLVSKNVTTIKKASTFTLRNQIAVAAIDLEDDQVLDRLNHFASYCRQLRDWVRNSPATYAVGFGDQQTSAQQQLGMSQTAIKSYADALEEQLKHEIRQQPAKAIFPELPALPSWATQ